MPATTARDLLAQLGPSANVRLGAGMAAPASAKAATSIPRARFEVRTLDAVLGGGLPRGRLSEIAGPSSCGKTSLLYALLAAGTMRGEVVALVDLADAFSPPTATAAGIDLMLTLWIRPTSFREALRCTELLLETPGFGTVAVDLGTAARGIRLDMGTGSRLVRAARCSSTALILLAPERVAGTSASLGLVLHPMRQHWSHRGLTLFDGFDTEIVLARNKLGIPGNTTIVRMTTL